MSKAEKLKQLLTENNYRGEVAAKKNAELFNAISEVLGGDQPDMLDAQWVDETKVQDGSQIISYLLYQIVLLNEKIEKLKGKEYF